MAPPLIRENLAADVNVRALLERRGNVTMTEPSLDAAGLPPDATAERAALVAFLRDEYPKVVASVALATGDRQGAEDAVQDALAQLWSRANDPRPDNPAAWVTVVASNMARSTRRRRGAEARAYQRSGVSPESTPDPTTAVGEATDVDRALRNLPARQRQIAVLYYVHDLSVAEIAASLGIHDGTVKTQLSRARTALAEKLARSPGGYER